eukprot:1531617-Lingulodinium_polyedra.AAC.1
MIDKVVSCIATVLLPRTPPEPVTAKWTKLMPCLAFFMAANVYGLLGALMEMVATAFRYPQPDQ